MATLKVFTGLIKNGIMGTPDPFLARPDDLILDIEELKQAIGNNLAPYLAAITGKMTYEIKVVRSIKTKDGLTKYGTTQQIISGYYKDGRPKYRTMTNKFAVLD